MPETKTLPLSARRELIVLVEPEANPQAAGGGIVPNDEINVAPLADFLSHTGVVLHQLFSAGEDPLGLAFASRNEGGTNQPNLSAFYRAEAPDNQLDELSHLMREHPQVATAYVKPAAELPIMFSEFLTEAGPPPPVTPLFTDRQGYLRKADEGGIDAIFASTIPGGKGRGVKIIDVEYAWDFDHQDLKENEGGVVGGIPPVDLAAINHGIAVIGIFSADENKFGITGICPEAIVSGVSIAGNDPPGWGSAPAIRHAADLLSPGDIMLIELQRPGPVAEFKPRPDQRGYIPIEWWPCDFAAIKYATDKGVIVVEAGGNGTSNLNAPIYDQNPGAPNGPFPATWHNPFRRNPMDSGAIVVGAGTSPPVTALDVIPDRARLGFSNFGDVIDAQGWGQRVVTCGYGDISQGNQDVKFFFTEQFNGTSSAAPMIVGALGCLQGILKEAGKPLLTPACARKLLRTIGNEQNEQQDGPLVPKSQRIGNRPNLQMLIDHLLA